MPAPVMVQPLQHYNPQAAIAAPIGWQNAASKPSSRQIRPASIHTPTIQKPTSCVTLSNACSAALRTSGASQPGMTNAPISILHHPLGSRPHLVDQLSPDPTPLRLLTEMSCRARNAAAIMSPLARNRHADAVAAGPLSGAEPTCRSE